MVMPPSPPKLNFQMNLRYLFSALANFLLAQKFSTKDRIYAPKPTTESRASMLTIDSPSAPQAQLVRNQSVDSITQLVAGVGLFFAQVYISLNKTTDELHFSDVR
jgi:hypothetical protein